MNNFLICDLQFGSTGKGAIAYYLAKKHSLTTAVCAYTPNAGHTAVDGYRKFIHTVLPIAAAVPSVTDVLLGPGAVFDPQLLCVEAERIAAAIGGEKNLIIHPAAVPLINEDSGSELKFVVIGSTMKGTAAANWRRMQRLPGTIVGDDWRDFDYVAARLWRAGWRLDVDAHKYGVALTRGELGGGCIVEGAQGYSLSVYHGFYPHVTSRDTTPNQIAADCGLGSRYAERYKVVGTMRTYPIRVANRFDADGKQVGWSGPFYPDSIELDWEKDLGLKPELTTVTKLPRRIATFSRQQVKGAVRICEPHQIFLNFAQYVADDDELLGFIEYVNSLGTKICYTGWGADNADIREIE